MFYGIFSPLEVKFADLRALKLVLWQWYRNNDKFKQRQECKCWFAWLLLNFSFLKKTWIEPTLCRKKSHYNCRHLRTDWDQQTFSRKKENSNHLKRSLFDAFFASTVLIPLPKIPHQPCCFSIMFRNCEFSGALKVSATWGKTATNITLIFSQYKNK